MFTMSRRFVILAFTTTVVSTALPAQETRWTVNAKTSAARWEVSPHWNALRATTCPEDPAWSPGEGTDHARASEWNRWVRAQGQRPTCTESVTGSLFIADTMQWAGVHGLISVRADQLVTGLSMRDRYARNVVLETQRYPEIRFMVDSLTGIQAGDTLSASAVGVFELRGVRQPMAIPVKAWREAGGLRVRGTFNIPARDLTERYRASEGALGLAVKHGVWKALEVGIDLTLLREPADITASR